MSTNKDKLLLHVCCGPCAVYPTKFLQEQNPVWWIFHNPNIHPVSEYSKRLENAKNLQILEILI